ncbi:MAG: hypothetical protein ACOY5Y_02835 [Pseudomonadota bacterium]
MSAPELRRLLDLARARGQTSLAQQLTAELESRTAAWRPPSVAAVQARLPEPAPLERPRRARNPLPAAAAGLAAAGLAWGLTIPIAPEQLAQARTDAGPVRLALAIAPDVTANEDRASAASAEVPPTVEAPPPPPPAAQTRPRPAHNPCYDEPTAAERLVCGFPALAERHRRMLDAYETARGAGADPLALDGAQAAWRARSANVSDRHLLADLYEERIRELRADAAAARRDQPPI